jgi:DNA-binding MarR family transcriptional regulator
MAELAANEILCACTSVRHTGRILAQLYDQILAPSGLRNTQFALLSLLDRDEPIGMGDLAEALGMDRTTLTRALAPLERQDWLLTEPAHDRRARQVRLTAAGVATLATARPLWQQAQDQVTAAFGAARLAALRQELAVLTAAVR